jgi:signal recognition particle subunit SRP54
MVLRDISDKILNFINDFKFSNSGQNHISEKINDILLGADIDQKLIDQVDAKINISNSERYTNSTERLRFLIYKILIKIFKNKKLPILHRHVIFVGLQGSGKTTSIVKYALYLSKQNKNVVVVCCDTYRAGAYDQLKQNANRAGIRFWGDRYEYNPLVIIRKAVKKFKKYDHILFDTSGRNIQDVGLMGEYDQIQKAILKKTIMLVCDGQHGNTVKKHIYGKVDMAIITKLDMCGGGGAISACNINKIPISHIGTGEHFQNFERYNEKVLASKITGYNTIINDKVSKKTWKKLSKNEYTLRDHYIQCCEFIKYRNIMSSMMGNDKNLNDIYKKINIHISMMKSMTELELETVNYIVLFKLTNKKMSSRVKRVILGSGSNYKDFLEMSDVIKKFKWMFQNNKHIFQNLDKFNFLQKLNI